MAKGKQRRMASTAHSLADRFWPKVDKSGECWLWTASKLPGGYGQLTYKGKHIVAHRTAWILTYGEIPKGLCVLHKCDNPPCVNPDHLFIGTKADNFMDMINKKRNSHGERHYRATITDAAVRRIRKMYDAGIGPSAIAETMGIEMKHASLIGRRKRWKHVE